MMLCIVKTAILGKMIQAKVENYGLVHFKFIIYMEKIQDEILMPSPITQKHILLKSWEIW